MDDENPTSDYIRRASVQSDCQLARMMAIQSKIYNSLNGSRTLIIQQPLHTRPPRRRKRNSDRHVTMA